MKKVDWFLFNNDELLIEKNDALAEVNEDFVIYKDEYGQHTISRAEKKYERVSEDSIMSILFKEKLLIIQFDGQKYTFDIECSYKDNDKEIILEYTLGDDKKIIKIIKKEEL